MPIDAPQPPQEQDSPYLPAGPPRPLVFEQFQGVNTQTTRPGVDDKQAFWLDSFMPIAPRNLRTMYGHHNIPIFASPLGVNTIVWFSFANVGNLVAMYCILTDGSLYETFIATNFSHQIAPPGTFTAVPISTNFGVANSGSSAVIFVAKQTNGYFIWDGTTFYTPGGVNYPPTGHPLPTGIGGTSVEMYTGHVWIANGATITFSAPGSLTDFTVANGGGSFTSTDSYLEFTYTKLIATNGFLYLIGDSSIDYISNVQTTGSGPAVTTFTKQNADPESGTIWPQSVGVWGRNIVFANSFGVHISYGSAVTKISDPLDGIYDTAANTVLLGPAPSAAKAEIFGRKCWIFLYTFVDPVTSLTLRKLLLWDGKIWWAATQQHTMTFIQGAEINSILQAYGTDGQSVWLLFSDPTTVLAKVAITKFWDSPSYMFQKATTRFWMITQYQNPAESFFVVQIQNENNANQVIDYTAPGTGIQILNPVALTQNGVLLGATLSTTCSDMTLISAMMDTKIVQYRG